MLAKYMAMFGLNVLGALVTTLVDWLIGYQSPSSPVPTGIHQVAFMLWGACMWNLWYKL